MMTAAQTLAAALADEERTKVDLEASLSDLGASIDVANAERAELRSALRGLVDWIDRGFVQEARCHVCEERMPIRPLDDLGYPIGRVLHADDCPYARAAALLGEE